MFLEALVGMITNNHPLIILFYVILLYWLYGRDAVLFFLCQVIPFQYVEFFDANTALRAFTMSHTCAWYTLITRPVSIRPLLLLGFILHCLFDYKALSSIAALVNPLVAIDRFGMPCFIYCILEKLISLLKKLISLLKKLIS